MYSIPRAVSSNRWARAIPLTTLRGVVLFLAVLLGACAGPGPSGTVAEIALELEAGSVELLRGATVEVAVVLAREGGASGDVELSVTGLPGDALVTATFSPPVLGDGASTSTLVLAAAPEAAEERLALTVVAAGQGLSASAPLDLDVVSLAVRGRVTGQRQAPQSGIAVSSQGRTAVTDDEGRFELSGLAVPYDLVLWSTGEGKAHVFEGLTADEVVLGTYFDRPAPQRSAAVVASLAQPVGPDQWVWVCVEGVDGRAAGCRNLSAGLQDVTLNVTWAGPEQRRVRLHLLVVASGEGGALYYPGYATRELALTHGTSLTLDSAIDMGAALASTPATVVFDPAAGVNLALTGVSLSPMATMRVDARGSPPNPLVIQLPAIDGVGYTTLLRAAAGAVAWSTVPAGGTVTIALPEAPSQVQPADGVTGVTLETEFTVDHPGGGPLTWTWAGGGVSIYLTTMSSTVKIPNVSAYGAPLPVGAAMSWRVTVLGGDSVEEGARMMHDQWAFDRLALVATHSDSITGAGFAVDSRGQAFTTAP